MLLFWSKTSVLTDGVGLKDIIQTLLQSSVSHDPSEIVLIFWFAAQETFIIISFENRNYIFLWKL